MRFAMIVFLLLVSMGIYGADLVVPEPGAVNSLVAVKAGRRKSCETTFELRPGMELEITWLHLPKNCPVAIEAPDGKVYKRDNDREFTVLDSGDSKDPFAAALQPSLLFVLKGEAARPGKYKVVTGPAPWWKKISATMVIAAWERPEKAADK